MIHRFDQKKFKMIKYRRKGERFIFDKDGVNFALTVEQIIEMEELFEEIHSEHSEHSIMACHVDGEVIRTCVIDTNEHSQCVHSKQITKKEDCSKWRKTKEVNITADF